LRKARRDATTICLAGVIAAGLVYALVAVARPLYEAQTVLVAPSVPLLEQFDRATAVEPSEADPLPGRGGLRNHDLGNVALVISSARRDLRADGTFDISIDSQAGSAHGIALQPPAAGSPTRWRTASSLGDHG
jgi:hypothetical protein